MLPRVDLTGRLRRKMFDRMRVVQLPLPRRGGRGAGPRPCASLVGRSPTGKFELDQDHAPQDNVT